MATQIKTNRSSILPQPGQYRWWHAVIFLVVVYALVYATQLLRDNGIQNYSNFEQAPFAPPSWLFGPVWLLNNASVLVGNILLLNKPADTPGRTPLLWLQAVNWLIFASFTYVYFVLDSPILAFIWTFGMFLLTVASMIISWRIDRRITASFITLILWLTLASGVAAYQFLYNADPLFGTTALLV